MENIYNDQHEKNDQHENSFFLCVRLDPCLLVLIDKNNSIVLVHDNSIEFHLLFWNDNFVFTNLCWSEKKTYFVAALWSPNSNNKLLYCKGPLLLSEILLLFINLCPQKKTTPYKGDKLNGVWKLVQEWNIVLALISVYCHCWKLSF